MKIRKLAEYCQKTLPDCEKCKYPDKCRKFKQYLQDYICPATTLINGDQICYPEKEF